MDGWCGLRDVSFFFQAEDGIRDHCVTGVQTCALPIWRRSPTSARSCAFHLLEGLQDRALVGDRRLLLPRVFDLDLRADPAALEDRPADRRTHRPGPAEIGRASCRERGRICEGAGADTE